MKNVEKKDRVISKRYIGYMLALKKGHKNMEKIVNGILNKIRRSKFFNWVLNILGIIGLDRLCRKVMYKWFEKHPTKDMINSRNYFEKHKKDIDRIEELLADDKSKRIWKSMIRFRQTMNFKEHPWMEENQYFVEGIIRLNTEEVFLDCGGYDGQTSLDFIKKVHNRFHKIVIFDPDPQCLTMIRNKIPDDRRITLIPKGCWDTETELSFVANGNQTSHVVDKDEAGQAGSISATAIDKCEECRDATFIKMDLEGAEQKALIGAREIIIKNKPKLAISIYHSDQDMIEIIDYIHELVPEYNLYVRHHSNSYQETVLYAVL